MRGESEWQYTTVISSPQKPQSQPQHQKINRQAQMSQRKRGKMVRSLGYVGMKVWTLALDEKEGHENRGNCKQSV